MNNTWPKLPYQPSKKLGQNFLFNQNYLQKIVEACPISPNTLIIEIGSGYGNLTNLLVKTVCQKVISIEKDPQLFKWLKENNSKLDKVLLLCQDALQINWPQFCSKYKKNSQIVVVGNLPYYLANSLIISLLSCYYLFKSLIFLVQKEVACRWVATPQKYKKEYSALSVYINLIAQVEILFLVSKQSFFPVPAVDGALVRLEIKPKPEISKILTEWNDNNLNKDFSTSHNSNQKINLTKFFKFLKNCFRYRRKTFWNNLLIAAYPKKKIQTIFSQLGYDKNIRAQNLILQDYLKVYELLHFFAS